MSRWLLDTVVVSELRKAKRADSKVRAWFQNTDTRSCYLSVITLSEIRIGISRVEKKDPDLAARLDKWYQNQVVVHFGNRLLGIDQSMAEKAAELIARHRLTPFDALIGATALSHNFSLVTRNVTHFESAGIPLVNPWEETV